MPHDIKDTTADRIDIDCRIRPANDNEQSTNRRERSYRLATEKIMTIGLGKKAVNYNFSLIHREESVQHDIQTRLKQKFFNRDRFRFLFMCYGQTGSGKTHAMSGGAWKNDGLL